MAQRSEGATMAIGKKTGGRDFVKGQSGNPGGMKPMSPEEKKLMSLSKQEVARLLVMCCEMTTDEMMTKNI